MSGEALEGAVTSGPVDAAVTPEAPVSLAEAVAPSGSTAASAATAFKLPSGELECL